MLLAFYNLCYTKTSDINRCVGYTVMLTVSHAADCYVYTVSPEWQYQSPMAKFNLQKSYTATAVMTWN